MDTVAVRPLGYAKIRIQNINFAHSYRDATQWDVDEHDVLGLVETYRKEGCKRHDVRNFLDVLAPAGITVPVTANINASLPEADMNVLGLQGLRRTLAAAKYLPLTDQWWPVKVYSCSLPEPVKFQISESYGHENTFKDGHIVRMILKYHLMGPKQAEMRWRGRLTKTKLHNLNKLLKLDGFGAALSKLLNFPGIWSGLELGSLHRLLYLKCNEVGRSIVVNKPWKHIR